MQTPENQLPEHELHARSGDRAADRGPDDLRRALGNAAVGQVLASTRLQRAGATSEQQLDEAVARSIQDRKGRGQPLDDATRERMEDSLGQDLSDVRVHADDDAHQLNEAVTAKAFTAGDDVFFSRGTYDPYSQGGQELLAHELTHVVQQRTGSSGLSPGEVSHPHDASEREAESVGRELASSGAMDTASAPAPAVSRQAEEEEELEVARSPEDGVARLSDEEEEEAEVM